MYTFERVVLLGKYNSEQSGATYMSKVAQYLDADLIELSDISKFHNLYESLRRFRVFRLIEQLPFYEALFRPLLVNLTCKFVDKKVKERFKNANIIVPSCSSSHLLAIAISLGCNSRTHYVCMDLPWGFNNAGVNKKAVERRTLRLMKSCASMNVCTIEMAQSLNLSNRESFFTTYSSIDLCVRSTSESEQNSISGPIRICYAGALRFRKKIQQFLNHLDELGVEYTFDLYSSGRLNDGRVNNLSFLPEDELSEKLGEYNFGLVAMSDQTEDSLVVSTSFPGKFVFYLLNNLTPVISAPSYASPVQLNKKYDLAILDPTSIISDATKFEDRKRFSESMKKEWKRYREFVCADS